MRSQDQLPYSIRWCQPCTWQGTVQAAADALGELEDLKEQLAAAMQSKSAAEREVQRAMNQMGKMREQQKKQQAESAEVRPAFVLYSLQEAQRVPEQLEFRLLLPCLARFS
jgi:hypothetical protein